MRTDEKATEIYDNLRTNYGDLFKACRLAGVSADFCSNWMRDDKVFREGVEEAQRVGRMGLVSVAVERATIGAPKGVYHKGVLVGTEYTPSDGLLTKLMEAYVPEFKKGEGANNQFNGPTQINIMPRAETYDQWLKMRDTTLERRAQAALPAPTVPLVLQGDYVDVSDAAKGAYALMAPPERPLAKLEGLL